MKIAEIRETLKRKIAANTTIPENEAACKYYQAIVDLLPDDMNGKDYLKVLAFIEHIPLPSRFSTPFGSFGGKTFIQKSGNEQEAHTEGLALLSLEAKTLLERETIKSKSSLDIFFEQTLEPIYKQLVNKYHDLFEPKHSYKYKTHPINGVDLPGIVEFQQYLFGIQRSSDKKAALKDFSRMVVSLEGFYVVGESEEEISEKIQLFLSKLPAHKKDHELFLEAVGGQVLFSIILEEIQRSVHYMEEDIAVATCVPSLVWNLVSGQLCCELTYTLNMFTLPNSGECIMCIYSDENKELIKTADPSYEKEVTCLPLMKTKAELKVIYDDDAKMCKLIVDSLEIDTFDPNLSCISDQAVEITKQASDKPRKSPSRGK